MTYPHDWPKCPSCGDFALHDHITCGRVECDEAGWRERKREEWRRGRFRLWPPRNEDDEE
jgi:hypothetical protein